MIEVGKKYIIKRDLRRFRFDDDPFLDLDMEKYEGETVTVTAYPLSNKHWFKVKENMWTWDDRWVDPADPVDIEAPEINIEQEDWEKVFEW